MKLQMEFQIILSYITCISLICAVYGDDFQEELFLKPLPPTHLYTYFQFTTQTGNYDEFTDINFHYSPRSLSEIVSRFQVEELHFTLTEGQWKHDQWGYPVLDAAPGAELYVWFSSDVKDIDKQWRKLSSTLAGLFCASLNFIDSSNTVTPQMALWPSGALKPNENLTSQLRYAILPKENVCTENLTPWKKLLPCASEKGFASLLNSRMIHNTHYHSLGLHVRRMCSTDNCAQTHLEIKQTVTLVYAYYQIINKYQQIDDWSFKTLFGRFLPGACPLSSKSQIYVDISSNKTAKFNLYIPPDRIVSSKRGATQTTLAVYEVDINEEVDQMINVVVERLKNNFVAPRPSLFSFSRYVLGYGKEFGGIVTELTNRYSTPINIVLLENVPWWLSIRLSTLRVNGEAKSPLLKAQYFSLGNARRKPYHLELLLELPPRSTTTVKIEFEFVFLQKDEYPPDPNHGFYLGSALISVNLPTARYYTSLPINGSSFDSCINASQSWYPIVFRTQASLVTLPLPDFSMAFNVICFAGIVMSGALKIMHNRIVKEVVLKPLELVRWNE